MMTKSNQIKSSQTKPIWKVQRHTMAMQMKRTHKSIKLKCRQATHTAGKLKLCRQDCMIELHVRSWTEADYLQQNRPTKVRMINNTHVLALHTVVIKLVRHKVSLIISMIDGDMYISPEQAASWQLGLVVL